MFGQQKAIERLEDRLARLEIKYDGLERTCRGLALEYEELWDKVRHQMSRISKRVAVEKKELDANGELKVPDDDFVGVDPISAKILARRGTRQRTE